MLIGEASGAAEDERGRPFVGKSGKELTRYLEKASKIKRSSVYITNLVKERPQTKKVGGNNAPTTDDIKRDEPELIQEIINVKPTFVVAVGRYSARWLLGSDASIESCHGFAFPIGEECRKRLLSSMAQSVPRPRAGLPSDVHHSGSSRHRSSRRGTHTGQAVQPSSISVHEIQSVDGKESGWLDRLHVIVVTHPAAGLHQSGTQPQINVDFIRLGQYVRGELDPTPPIDQFPDPDYYEIRQPIPQLSPRDVAVDTESRLDGSHIWGGSYSFHPGSGAVIRAANRRLLPSFRDLLFTHRIGLHNAPHDLRVIAKWLGLSIYDLCSQMRFECTMQMAFVYRLLPLALKSIGKRFFGMPTRDYREVVGPADQQLAVEYLLKVLDNQCVVCGGVGQLVDDTRKHKTSGKLLEPKAVPCSECGGDGTGWDAPEEQLKWDNKKKRMTISRGQRMGTRVRKALERVDTLELEGGADSAVDQYSQQEIDEGDDKPPAGLQKWWRSQMKYEFRLQAEEQLGQIPEATLHDIDQSVAIEYSACDSDMTVRFWPYVEKLVKDEGLWSVYEVDRDAMPMFCQMMEVGWKIDVPYLKELSNQLSNQMDVKLYELEQLVGHYVSPSSYTQVGDLLFGELGMEPLYITDSGAPSTKDDVLSDLKLQAAKLMDESEQHRTQFRSIELIQDHRELSKLKSTYTIKLPRMVDDSDRVHTELKQAVTESRRPASRNPNLANVPTRSDNGRLVKYAFTCDPDHVLVEADFSQAEFKVLAHESGEKSLINAINDGLDPHALTTSKIFGIPLKKVDKNSWQRRVSKMVSFLILYGGSAVLLKAKLKTEAQMDVPVEDCQKWIDDYTSAKGYAAIGEYIQDSIAMARRYGYVADSWGHRRYLPGVYSELYGVRAEAERIAVNHRIQSYVSGVIKQAMITLWNDSLPRFRKRAYCEPLMQIYDSLVTEVHKSIAEEWRDEMVRVMSNVVKLKVPLTAEGKIGTRWSELE